MVNNIMVGKPDVKRSAPSHVKGIKEGNSVGHYERQRGNLPDGRTTAERSTGINPRHRNPIDPRMPRLFPA